MAEISALSLSVHSRVPALALLSLQIRKSKRGVLKFSDFGAKLFYMILHLTIGVTKVYHSIVNPDFYHRGLFRADSKPN